MAAPEATLLVEPSTAKRFHIFISYRVQSDRALAEKLCDKLQQLEIDREPAMRIKCFFDAQDLTAGKSFETELMDALHGSCLFLPLLSAGGLAPLASLQEGGVDMCAREYVQALTLAAKSQIDILPLFIGTVSGGAYTRFNEFGTSYPAVHAQNAGQLTVADALKSLFALQGLFVNPDDVMDSVRHVGRKFSFNVWPAHRVYWSDQESLGPDRIELCVQCGAEFTTTNNAAGACAFHPRGVGYSNEYPCCHTRSGRGSQPPGCVRKRHVSEHHMNYPYARFADYVAAILNYTDARDVYFEVEAENYESNKSMSASFGLVTKGLEDQKLYVQMGFYTSFFRTYDRRALEDIVSLASTQSRRVATGTSTKNVEQSDAHDASYVELSDDILPGTHGDGRYVRTATVTTKNGSAFLDWLLENGAVVGVRITCTSPTSATPAVTSARFVPTDDGFKLDGPAVVESRAGIVEGAPSAPYALGNVVVTKGATLLGRELREPDAPTAPVGPLPVRFKLNGNVYCNDGVLRGAELFHLDGSLINLDEAKAVTIAGLKARWTLRGEGATPAPDSWSEAKVMVVSDRGGIIENAIPAKIAASDVMALNLSVVIPYENRPASVDTVRGYSWIGRDNAVLIELEVENAAGLTSHTVFEYVNRMNRTEISTFYDTDIPVWIDDIDANERLFVSVRMPKNDARKVIELSGFNRSYSFSPQALRIVVHKAQATGSPDVPIEFDSASVPAPLKLEASFVVDVPCHRVAALRVHLTNTATGGESIGILEVPLYGETATKADPSPAVLALRDLPAGFVRHDGSKSLPPVPKGPVTLRGAAPAPAPTPAAASGAAPAAIDMSALAAAVSAHVREAVAALRAEDAATLNARFDALEKALVGRIDALEATVAQRLDALQRQASSAAAPAAAPAKPTAAPVSAAKPTTPTLPGAYTGSLAGANASSASASQDRKQLYGIRR